MAKVEVKTFNIFCRNDDEGNPIFHKITITEKGAIRLHDHPEVQSEVYYHLLMVQKLKGEVDTSGYSWRRRTKYDCSGCLQFYFSLIHKKFEHHIKDIEFVTKHSEDNINYDRADNERIEHYLEKVRERTRDRERFDRSAKWSEEAFYRNNKAYWSAGQRRIFEKLFKQGIEKIPRYDISLDLTFKKDPIENPIIPEVRTGVTTTDKYSFRSSMTQRCSSSRNSWGRESRKNDGYMNINLTIHRSWWTDVRDKNLAVIKTEKHGTFFVLQAIPEARGYLVDGIVISAGTKKKYEVKTFYIEKNTVTGGWNARRKNKVKGKGVNAKHDRLQSDDEEDSAPF